MQNDAGSDDGPIGADPGDGSIDPDILAVRAIMASDEARQPPPRQTRAQETPRRPARDCGPSAHAPAPLHKPRIPWRWLIARARRFLAHPDAPKRLALLFLVLLVILRPGFILFLIVLTLLTGAVLYFSFGPEAVQTWILSRYHRLRERDPEAAERLRSRAAKASRRLSAGLDRLPDHWTDGLYLPDFEPTPPETTRSDPFDRLARQ